MSILLLPCAENPVERRLAALLDRQVCIIDPAEVSLYPLGKLIQVTRTERQRTYTGADSEECEAVFPVVQCILHSERI